MDCSRPGGLRPTREGASKFEENGVLAAGKAVIEEEAAALLRLASELGRSFVDAVETMHSCRGRVILTGVGKSGLVARKIAATLASTGQPAQFVHATEASHGDLGMVGVADVVIAVSRSGETRELADIVAYTKRFSIPLVAITAMPASSLGRVADVCIQIPDLPEATADIDAPTTSTTLQIALGDALAVALLRRRDFQPHHFKIFHPGGQLGAHLLVASDLMHAGDSLPIVSLDSSITEAVLIMSEKRLGCVGVVDDEKLVGVITDGDLRRHMDGLTARALKDVMTADPVSIPPNMLAGEALQLMNSDSRPVTALFVVTDDMRPIGVVHIHDVLRAGVA